MKNVVPRAAQYLRTLGPGLITGASDDDPSGISTYSIAGASAGYTMLWTALITTPMMAVIDGVCARIGAITGGGLMRTLTGIMPRPVALMLALLVLSANTLNVGADINGMAASAHMLLPVPSRFWILLFTGIIVVVEVFYSYRHFARIVKWLCMSLFAYVITAFIVHPPWKEILGYTFVPHFVWTASWLTTLTGVLGTTITPYLFFWQASMTVENTLEHSAAKQPPPPSAQTIRDLHTDVNSGAIYSNVIMFFIIVTSAATIFAHGGTIGTAQDAAMALRPLAGNLAYALFAAGIIGTGLLAVPVIAGSSGYMIAELFNIPEGLHQKLRQAPGFYGVILLGLLAGTVMDIVHVDAIKALFWSAVSNGVAAVPLVYAIIRVSQNANVLGKWVASPAATGWLWLTFALMLLSAAGMFVSWIPGL